MPEAFSAIVEKLFQRGVGIYPRNRGGCGARGGYKFRKSDLNFTILH